MPNEEDPAMTNDPAASTDIADETSVEFLFDRLLGSSAASVTTRNDSPTPTRIELSDHGQIARMSLPLHWQEGQPSTRATSYFRQFHPVDAPDARLCFYYRGRRLDRATADAFVWHLQQAPHYLGPEEVISLRSLLRDRAPSPDFSLFFARTEDLQGKVVLLVEGRFPEPQQVTRHIFIDSDATGSAVQEIFFQAPEAKFSRYAGQIQQALDSIEWKGL